MKLRPIPTKNYVITIIVAVVTIFLTFYFKSMYELNKQYNDETSKLSSTLTEISYSTLENYLYEHPETIIYITDTSVNTKSKMKFENNYIKIIEKNELENQLVYIDLSKITEEEKTKFYKNYSSGLINKEEIFDNVPNILSIKDKKVVNTLFHTYSRINSDDISKFLKNIEESDVND